MCYRDICGHFGYSSADVARQISFELNVRTRDCLEDAVVQGIREAKSQSDLGTAWFGNR